MQSSMAITLSQVVAREVTTMSLNYHRTLNITISVMHVVQSHGNMCPYGTCP